MNYMSRVQILTLAVLLIGVLGISAMGVAVVLGAQQSAPVVTLAPVVKLAVALPSETAWTVPTLPPALTVTPAVETQPTEFIYVVLSPTPSPVRPAPTRRPTVRAPQHTALPSVQEAAAENLPAQEPQATVIAHLDIPNATVAFYNIPGQDAESAWALAQDAFPLKATTDGEVGAAQALWTRTECVGGRLEFEWSLTVYLPYWQAPSGVDSFEIQYGWNQPLLTLARHEAGHVRIYEEGLQAARAGLPGPDCAADTAYLNAQTRAIAQQQEAYDVQTDHGLSQP